MINNTPPQGVSKENSHSLIIAKLVVLHLLPSDCQAVVKIFSRESYGD
jgi:hypothetical protein